MASRFLLLRSNSARIPIIKRNLAWCSVDGVSRSQTLTSGLGVQQYSTALREHAPHYAKMKGQRENHSGKLDILKDKKIGFIGGGKMAEAIVNGMLAQEIPASAITVSDPNPGTEGALLFF